MRLLVDMKLSPELAMLLRDAGHDAVHVRDLRMQESPDERIFRRAAADGRIVLTCDLDFGEIVALAGRLRAVWS